MRKITATTFVSLDGIMQAPGGPEEDPTGGFKFGGWVVPLFDDELGAAIGGTFARPFDLLLGRKTYDIFAAHWPYAENTSDAEIAFAFNKATKYVASRSRRDFGWANTEWLGEDAVAGLKKIRSGEGPDLIVQGSGDFLQTLFRHRLIDELTLLTFPILLGSGKRLFRDGLAPAALQLVSSKSTPSGGVVSTYRPSGEVGTGSFALEDISEVERERRASLT
ncbi:MAG: dihydrofolate reductase family protein [Mesorhizobium sp.]|nr:dihydrofolate reductase family protein [Mesorhizobium sp.]MBL8577030.1 dihydrofolate reductase family protein [Mesorhizobium sp.]